MTPQLLAGKWAESVALAQTFVFFKKYIVYFLKDFIEFVIVLLFLCFFIFAHKSCAILAPRPGV